MADLIRPLRGAFPGPVMEPDPVVRTSLVLLGQVGVRYGGFGDPSSLIHPVSEMLASFGYGVADTRIPSFGAG